MKKLFLLAFTVAVALAATFSQTGVAFAAGDFIEIDETYVKEAIVSEVPIELSAVAKNSDRRILFGEEIVFTVKNGDGVAKVENGLLTVSDEGSFILRAEMKSNPSVFKEVECVAYKAVFSNVTILSSLENVTVYSQPVYLAGRIDVEGIDFPADAHYELRYEVTEGPAEIYSERWLRFTGAGKVTVRAYSRFDPSVYAEKSVTVADPDENSDTSSKGENLSQKDVTAKRGGCGAGISSCSGVLFAAVALTIVMIAKKRRI